MEQILAFVLGAVTVFIIWGVVIAFKTASKVKDLLLTVEDIHHKIDENDLQVHRRIDGEIDRVNQLHTESIRHTDSRVDKLEQKLTGNLGAKEILKG